jgi:hypothetical protein
VRITISGKAMSCMEGSQIYIGENYTSDDELDARVGKALRDAEVVTRGKGVSCIVTCDEDVAEIIAEYCEMVGPSLIAFTDRDDQSSKSEGRALVTTGERIRKQLAVKEQA